MDTVNQNNLPEVKVVTPIAPAAKKPASKKLPSKPISFSSQPASKKSGKQVKADINKSKMGGHLLKKLTGKQ